MARNYWVPGIERPKVPRILTNLHHATSPMEHVRSRKSRRDRFSEGQERARIVITPALTT